jgi:endonuclease-3 related protein
MVLKSLIPCPEEQVGESPFLRNPKPLQALLDLRWPGGYRAIRQAISAVPQKDTPLTKIVQARAPALHASVLLQYYEALHSALGPQSWWPARTPFEVIVGAILTQNTSWTNVERAIGNLRAAKLLAPRAILRAPTARLARLIRSSGYFRQKAKKLKAFVRFLQEDHGGSLARMFRTPTAELRNKLLGVHGIGPETADSILLYAGKHPVFVVDAYTRRILERHGHSALGESYESIQERFHGSLPRAVSLFNEYHALIVRTGKDWCRPHSPRCEQCPLSPFLPSHPLPPVAVPSRMHYAQSEPASS